MNKFPLTARKDGRFCKRVRGKTHYFTGTPEEALREWLRVKDHLEAGDDPPNKPIDGDVTVKQLCNEFTAWKLSLVESGDIAPRTMDDLRRICKVVMQGFPGRTVASLTPADFARLRSKMASGWGPQTLTNAMGIVRSIFNYGAESKLVTQPNFGPSFARPSARLIRSVREARGPQMMEAEVIRLLIDGADTNMKAMILLGINGGLGDSEVIRLPVDIAAEAVSTGWLNYARHKTGVARRIPLWKETADALRAVIASRRQPRNASSVGLTFIAPKRGGAYAHGHANRLPEFLAAAAEKAGLMGRHHFYDLRRTFQTIGEESNDLVAVQSIMGHAPKSNDMSARYRQRVTDARLLAVTNHIRGWLYDTIATTGTQTS